METKWIPFSERMPDCRWLAGRYDGSFCRWIEGQGVNAPGVCDPERFTKLWTHWCAIPDSPPREPTQAEKDEEVCVEFDTEAFESWMLNDPCGREVKRRELHQAWMLASGLARKHERAEIVKLLDACVNEAGSESAIRTLLGNHFDAIRARCGGGE